MFCDGQGTRISEKSVRALVQRLRDARKEISIVYLGKPNWGRYTKSMHRCIRCHIFIEMKKNKIQLNVNNGEEGLLVRLKRALFHAQNPRFCSAKVYQSSWSSQDPPNKTSRPVKPSDQNFPGPKPPGKFGTLGTNNNQSTNVALPKAGEPWKIGQKNPISNYTDMVAIMEERFNMFFVKKGGCLRASSKNSWT